MLHTSLHAPPLGQDAQFPLDLPVQFDTVGDSHRSSLLERECASIHKVYQIERFALATPRRLRDEGTVAMARAFAGS